MNAAYVTDGYHNPPRGTRGGGDAAPSVPFRVKADGTREPLPTIASVPLAPGELLGHELTLRKLGRLAQGAAVLGYAVWAGGIPWTPGRLALLPATVACGVCVMLGILVLQATSAFWTPTVRPR